MKYPKAEIQRNSKKDVVLIPEDKLVNIRNQQRIEPGSMINHRTHGEFGYHSFCLVTDNYDWQIIKDDLGVVVLVPTKKD